MRLSVLHGVSLGLHGHCVARLGAGNPSGLDLRLCTALAWAWHGGLVIAIQPLSSALALSRAHLALIFRHHAFRDMPRQTGVYLVAGLPAVALAAVAARVASRAIEGWTALGKKLQGLYMVIAALAGALPLPLIEALVLVPALRRDPGLALGR